MYAFGCFTIWAEPRYPLSSRDDSTVLILKTLLYLPLLLSSTIFHHKAARLRSLIPWPPHLCVLLCFAVLLQFLLHKNASGQCQRTCHQTPLGSEKSTRKLWLRNKHYITLLYILPNLFERFWKHVPTSYIMLLHNLVSDFFPSAHQDFEMPLKPACRLPHATSSFESFDSFSATASGSKASAAAALHKWQWQHVAATVNGTALWTWKVWAKLAQVC